MSTGRCRLGNHRPTVIRHPCLAGFDIRLELKDRLRFKLEIPGTGTRSVFECVRGGRGASSLAKVPEKRIGTLAREDGGGGSRVINYLNFRYCMTVQNCGINYN